MGDLIVLAERRADRRAAGHQSAYSGPPASAGDVSERPVFFFDLACPFSYLVAERVERTLGEVEWVPASRAALPNGSPSWRSPKLRQLAERRASELRLPLVWPECAPSGTPSVLRAAAYAADLGAGATFALAASRLAFCGGFDLEDPEILAEAAAAAGIPLEGCLAAVGDPSWDDELRVVGYGLASRGITELPAIRVGGRVIQGERCLAEAAALVSISGAERRPLAPVG
jgi:2-hydroxychromene-2-carboxylate isomerase